MNVFFSLEYVVAEHDFETTRKAGWVAESLVRRPLPGLRIVAPPAIPRESLLAVHSADYVDAVANGQPARLASSQGFVWGPRLYSAVAASTGGVVAAAREAGISGSLSSGLHHARHGHGCGFCTFNGLALAAKDAIRRGVPSVLILDFDAHGGGGTASLIAGEPRITQLDISTNDFDSYPDAGNARLVIAEPKNYLQTIESELNRLGHAGYGLVLYNAGVDPAGDGVSQADLVTREEIVFEWIDSQESPAAFVLAGGYVGDGLTRNELVALHVSTITKAHEIWARKQALKQRHSNRWRLGEEEARR
ncbi:MAG: Rhodococcus phage [Planctomycetota bacterium]|jgi:acetoin utilization deacetylase AcuC-like enzyme